MLVEKHVVATYDLDVKFKGLTQDQYDEVCAFVSGIASASNCPEEPVKSEESDKPEPQETVGPEEKKKMAEDLQISESDDLPEESEEESPKEEIKPEKPHFKPHNERGAGHREIDGITGHDLKNKIRELLEENIKLKGSTVTEKIFGENYTKRQKARVYAQYRPIKVELEKKMLDDKRAEESKVNGQNDGIEKMNTINWDYLIPAFENASNSYEKMISVGRLRGTAGLGSFEPKEFMKFMLENESAKELVEEKVGYTFDVLQESGTMYIIITGKKEDS